MIEGVTLIFQFIDLLPAGSLLSVVTAGYRAREVTE